MLEPNDNQAAKDYQKRLFEQGIPVTMFGVDDVRKEYDRLLKHGVKFTMEPIKMGDSKIAFLTIHVEIGIWIIQQTLRKQPSIKSLDLFAMWI